MDTGRMDTRAGDWGASGLAYLTGLPDGPPDFSRAPVMARAREIAADFQARTATAVDAAVLLSGRAALLGLTRRGQASAGGATRLLPTRDGWCAVTLARPDDVDAVPAMVETDTWPTSAEEAWPVLRRWAATRSGTEVVERARLLDLPAALVGEVRAEDPVVRRIGPPTRSRGPAGLLVVDLSSMWAGPSCAQLLARSGATVVKVESRRRPDGTRSGPRSFFDWVNGGKLCYAADFDDPGPLRELLAMADVVIESSRPAGLRRRGLGPAAMAREGSVWLTITGYGADGDRADQVAFGDDAAVAGGLVATSDRGPVFCGDAIADPLTGLHAALAVVEALEHGGGVVVEVAMAAVAASYAALPRVPGSAGHHAAPPVAPPPSTPASELDGDRAAVDRMIDERRLAAC